MKFVIRVQIFTINNDVVKCYNLLIDYKNIKTQGNNMEKYTEMFKALSNETRLSILVILNQHELCVCQIEDFLNLSQVSVSRHLTILRNAKLVTYRREGLHIYYSIIKPKTKLDKKVFEILQVIENTKKKLKLNKSQIKKCEEC